MQRSPGSTRDQDSERYHDRDKAYQDELAEPKDHTRYDVASTPSDTEGQCPDAAATDQFERPWSPANL